MLRIAAAIVAVGAVASCATLNEDECRSVNWEQLGQQDGLAGRASSYVEQHRSACSEHGLPVDDRQWSVGWERGIRLYCTPENGLLEGREGRSYMNSCPADLKAGFEQAYSVARALHDARASRDALESEINALYDALKAAQKPEDRKRIEIDIEAKRFSLRGAERRVRDAERDYELYVFTNGFPRG